MNKYSQESIEKKVTNGDYFLHSGALILDKLPEYIKKFRII